MFHNDALCFTYFFIYTKHIYLSTVYSSHTFPYIVV